MKAKSKGILQKKNIKNESQMEGKLQKNIKQKEAYCKIISKMKAK
jgi:hypothetical protein